MLSLYPEKVSRYISPIFLLWKELIGQKYFHLRFRFRRAIRITCTEVARIPQRQAQCSTINGTKESVLRPFYSIWISQFIRSTYTYSGLVFSTLNWGCKSRNTVPFNNILILQMSSRLYEQDSAILRLSTLRLVGMCEAGVDLAWEEAGRSGSTAQPLPDSHPLVRTERAVWEVRAAARLLLTSLQVG